MKTISKKQFERLYQSGEVREIRKDQYAFVNNEENLSVLFDLAESKVIENSHNNLSQTQLNKLWDEIFDFRKEEIDAQYWEDDVMSDREIFETFY